MHQVYIDPIFIKGNILRTYILWDWKTRIELRVEFLNRINFVVELMRRSNINVVMTKQEFINMEFKEFPGLKTEIVKIDF